MTAGRVFLLEGIHTFSNTLYYVSTAHRNIILCKIVLTKNGNLILFDPFPLMEVKGYIHCYQMLAFIQTVWILCPYISTVDFINKTINKTLDFHTIRELDFNVRPAIPQAKMINTFKCNRTVKYFLSTVNVLNCKL